ncbi:MAG: hypothetical protein WDN31_13415 [Hyphomicrobium sp.]
MGGRRLRLALGRQHHAGIDAGAVRKRRRARLDEPHAMTRARQHHGLPEAENSGTENGDGAR